MADRVRVIAFDDNKDLREMFRMLVDAQADMVCVVVLPDLSQLMRDIDAAQPDVIVMDIQMPGMNGIDGVKAIKTRYPEARILMQTVFEDEDKVFDAICAGASGYILKTASADEMVGAIRSVHAGGSPMTPSIAAKVLARFRANAAPNSSEEEYNLTQRERDVLGLLVKGLSYKMIADRIGISFHTVDSHIRKIYDKLHVSGMAEAVSKAVRKRIV
ncbi:MAG TPA: response regulator transcription factor [Flavobacteriales bacterium]|jgi:DNA-binding NarL/FixJ family response regulator|nr:response regulator transcription factor [Flavobacteriales bacterium]HMU14610.1 response regulator transcription factor [Flavobacteriales bacterium]HNI05709.1 response regulator transcription factor [Flavobacteriales bacterium]HNM70227.1 response regulator transcription factor [Flavobacteriales bacterium]HNO05411.1 response regulator transcription factor [Flavobacteriales bacterium]